MKRSSPEPFKVSWWYVSFGAAVLLLLWSLAPFLIQIVYRVDTLSEAGTVGDSYGAFNALVSSGAMVALVVSIYLQRLDLRNQQEELSLQREEMKLTREALEAQQKEMAASAKALGSQQELSVLAAKLNALDALIDFNNTSIGRYFKNDRRISIPLRSHEECRDLLDSLHDYKNEDLEDLEQRQGTIDDEDFDRFWGNIERRYKRVRPALEKTFDLFMDRGRVYAELAGRKDFEMVFADPPEDRVREDAMCDQAEEECERGEDEEEK